MIKDLTEKHGETVLVRLIYSMIAAVVIAAFWYVIPIAAEREAHRQEVVKERNCELYGAAINEAAGKDICPPTPSGS